MKKYITISLALGAALVIQIINAGPGNGSVTATNCADAYSCRYSDMIGGYHECSQRSVQAGGGGTDAKPAGGGCGSFRAGGSDCTGAPANCGDPAASFIAKPSPEG